MRIRYAALLGLAALVGAASRAAPATPPADSLMLSGLDSIKGLEGTGKASVSRECVQGKGAVRWSVGAGRGHGLTLSFAGRGIEAAEWGELRFRYKVVAGGWTWFGIKLVDHPVGKGMQATWRLAGREELQPGGWREAVIDLSKPMYLWGNRPDETSQWVCFRAMADGPAAILLDDLRLTRPALRTRILVTRALTTPNGTRRCAWDIELTNPTKAPRRVLVAFDAKGLVIFEPRTSTRELTIEPTKRVKVTFALEASRARLAAAEPLAVEHGIIHFVVDARPRPLDYPLEIEAVVPLAPHDHPCLLVTREGVEAIKKKAAERPWAKSAHDALLKSAGGWLGRTIKVPERGGQWWHWYSCPKDGTRLKTVSPTKHRCPTCGKVYTGEPYDSVVVNRDHSALARATEELGLAWQLSGERPYAAKAAEILERYAERYLAYPRHTIHGHDRVGGGRVGPQTLDEAVWLIPVVRGYDLVWDALSPDQRETIETKLLRPCADVILEHKIGIHNIQCWKNSAVGLVGICLDEPRYLADAVTSPRGIRQQLAKGILDDGSWFEGAWGYHYYTMSALAPLAEALRNVGVDVYTDRYRSFYAAPLRFALPNGRLPAFNDSGEANAYGPWTRYEVAYARWRDPLFAAMLKDRRRTSRESLLFGVSEPDASAQFPAGSRNYPVSGYAYLQCDEGTNAPVAVVDYAPHGGGHGHPEKLQLLLYARGEIVAPDPGCIAYGVPLHREWYRQTIAHNTVAVDRRSQKPCRGKLGLYAATPELAVVSASADDAYDGVRFRRTVAMLSGGLAVDLVEVASDKPHLYDWAFHCYGDFETPLKLNRRFAAPGKANGYQHIRGPRGAAADGLVAGQWRGAKSAVSLAMLGAKGTHVYAGDGHGQPSARKLPTLIVRRQGTRAAFASAFRIAAPDAEPVALVPAPAAKGTLRLVLRAGDEAAAVGVTPAFWQPPEPKKPDLPPLLAFETDARAAVVRTKAGKLRGFALVEGTTLQTGSTVVACSRPTTLSLTYRPRGKSLLVLGGTCQVTVKIAGLFPKAPAVATADGAPADATWKRGILSLRAKPGQYLIAPAPPPAHPPQKPEPGSTP